MSVVYVRALLSVRECLLARTQDVFQCCEACSAFVFPLCLSAFVSLSSIRACVSLCLAPRSICPSASLCVPPSLPCCLSFASDLRTPMDRGRPLPAFTLPACRPAAAEERRAVCNVSMPFARVLARVLRCGSLCPCLPCGSVRGVPFLPLSRPFFQAVINKCFPLHGAQTTRILNGGALCACVLLFCMRVCGSSPSLQCCRHLQAYLNQRCVCF